MSHLLFSNWAFQLSLAIGNQIVAQEIQKTGQAQLTVDDGMATLVDVLSGTFNVRINNPEQCRHAVVNRKLRLTRFLDFLRNNLIAYSQR